MKTTNMKVYCVQSTVYSVKCMVYGVVAAMLLLTGTVQAVDYKNSYRAEYSAQSMEYRAPGTVTAPEATFQSTTTMIGSGSAYSATPSLNEDGTATYEGASEPSAALAPGRSIRKSGAFDDDDDDMPLGDGLWVLATLACAYLIVRAARVRKREKVE